MINARNSQYPFKSSLAAIAVCTVRGCLAAQLQQRPARYMTANLDICENTNARFSTLANYDQQEVVLSGVVMVVVFRVPSNLVAFSWGECDRRVPGVLFSLPIMN